MTRVRVGGVWLDSLFPVGDVMDSTILRTEGWSGDYQLSCSWAAPGSFSAPWFMRGALVQVVETGLVTWSGRLAEPEAGDSWGLTAYGMGASADELQSVVAGPAISQVPDAVVDYAASRGSGFRRYGSIGSAPVAVEDDGKITTVTKVLDRAAAAAGEYWYVDSAGEVRLLANTEQEWSLVPGTVDYMGTADEEFVTHLYGLYVSSVDGTTGEPNGWSLVLAADDAAAEKFGQRREQTVDLSALGQVSASAAQAQVDARLRRVGGRMGWTSEIDLTSVNVRRPMAGLVSPLSVRAGDFLNISGITDDRSSATYQATVRVVLGEVTRVHTENRAVARPVGFIARDFQGALAAAQAPPTGVTVA